MNLSKWLRFGSRQVLFLIALCGALIPSTSLAAFKSNLQGQDAGSTNWGGGPLHGWQELDYIPIRTLFTGGPATNQVINVDFDHSKSSGTVKGIENLTGFFASSNVKITSPPTLSTPNVDIWRYSYTITITNAQAGFVEFRGRLAAGSHLFSGSSLNLASPTLSIFKPAAQPGLPDMAIVKSGPSQAARGQIITYVLNYTNLASAAVTATGVQVSDVLPSAVTYVPGSASSGGTIVGNTITWDRGNLSPGARGSVSYKVMVNTNLTVTTTFANYAQILSSQNDANTANNLSVVTTTVVVTPTPVANDDFYSIDQTAVLNVSAPGVLANDFDAATNALTAILVSVPNNGALVFNTNGSFSYTPLTNFTGLDTFSYKASNGVSNSGPALVTINVTNSCSVIISSNITVNNDLGQCGAIVNFPAPITTGLCTPVTCTPTNGSFFPVGTTTVTCTNIQGNGGTFTVTVLDSQPPTITCPSNVTVVAGSDCTASNVNLGTPVAADNCSVDGVINDAPVAFAVGTNVVTWTAFDDAGNAASCQQLVIVQDLTPPTITCPSNLVVSANADCGATNVNLGTPVTSDNCGVASVTNDAPATFGAGTNIVTWTVSDTSGNSATCQQLVVVSDLTSPTITCPADLVVPANSGCGATNVNLGTPVTSDNCGVASVTNNAPASYGAGTNVVTWTVVDTSGNIASCQQRVIVHDASLPVLVCPSNLVVSANSGCGTTNVSLGTPVTSDNCAVVSVTNNAPSVFAAGTNVVTWTATDTAGNVATCPQFVVVRDTTPPTIACPANVTVSANSGCGATNISLGTPITSDNCGVASVTNNAPTALAAGTNVVIWTVVDTSGNTATCQQLVVVRDTTPPTITCPANVTVFANAGCSATNVALGSPVVSDTCGLASVTNNASASFAIGTNTVTWTATDTSGNTAGCQQLVIVRDTTPPTITCPSNLLVSANAGCGATNVLLGAPVISDNCAGVSATNNAPSVFAAGTNVVTWTAFDTAGNATTCQQLVVVRDSTPPTITCPVNLTVSANSGCNATNVSLGTPVVADSCGVGTVTNNAPAVFTDGTNVVTWTVTDTSGNTAACQQFVVVHDTTPPTITCPANVAMAANSGCGATNVSLGTPTTSDNCGVATVTNNAPGTFSAGTNVVTWTVTDTSGNSSTCQQLVIVHDATLPAITCPANIVRSTDSGQCSASNVTFNVATSDNCAGGVTLVVNPPSGSMFSKGTTMVHCYATDAAGNSNGCSFTVTVNDTEAPSITCPGDIDVTAGQGQNSIAVGYSTTVTDNCPGVNSTNVPASGSSFPIGVTIVTCTATDASGNTNVCTFRVSVNPSTSPGILVATFVNSPMVLNPQTGLFEQSVRLSNQGGITVTNSRVYVLGLPSTNTLYNRSGVAVPGGATNLAPYVQYNQPLAPGSNVVFLLEYYIPNLKAITNQTLLAEQVLPSIPPGLPPGAQQVALQAGRDPLQLSNGRFLLEWPAIIGRTYTIQYSSDMTNWKTVVPSIVAASTAVQWFDDGPPKTETKPSQAGSRFYRVFLLPAN